MGRSPTGTIASLMIAVAGSLTVFAAPARGQPFLGDGTAFDPEVDVIQSGALLDAQVVVSHDRRYVTITTRASNTRLQDLVLFPVQTAGSLGFVGGVNPGGGAGPAPSAAPGGGARAAAGAFNTSPTAIGNQNSLLGREGTFLLARLE